MKTLEAKIKFTAPAFLGNAEQSGQWRTPPFKALLRSWWRVAYSSSHKWPSDVSGMLNAERELFGAAADDKSSKSKVLIRLDSWGEGKLKNWSDNLASIAHKPSLLKHDETNGKRVDAALYLGYGPLTFSKGAAVLKANAAIQAGESNRLRLGFPTENELELKTAVALAHQYGTCGGRSRNGWGSIELPEVLQINTRDFCRPLTDALKFEWPHCVGEDPLGPLIWTTKPEKDWASVMTQLAKFKIDLRTQFKFTSGNTNQPETRHYISYPVTNHVVSSWDKKFRLPNSLRFKLRTEGDKCVGVIFHMPCKPPIVSSDSGQLLDMWQKIHAYLDQQKDTLNRSLL